MIDLRLKTYALAAAVFALDRLSKCIVETYVSFADAYKVIPGFFDIVHSQNRGIVFGIFNDSASPFRTGVLIVFSLAAVVFIAGMLWKATDLDRLSAWGLALIFGGAMGNIFDRIAWGRVTDFLEFYIGNLHWPTFNLADAAIVTGCGLLLIYLLKPKREATRT